MDPKADAGALQDVRMIFEMFDANNDGTMDLAEFENITDNLRQQGKLSPGGATRTGFKEKAEYAPRSCSHPAESALLSHAVK